MKYYQNEEKVHAEPMTRKIAESLNLIRNKETNETPNEPGYVLLHKNGFNSWIPAEIFEDDYVCINPVN